MSEALRIDDLDRALISRLKLDANITNRALGERLGVTEQTIAVRIRRLEEANLLRVLAVLDAKAVGYELLVIAAIQVAGRAPAEVAAEIARLPSINGVTACLGGFELIATLHARDERDLFEQLERQMGAIRGVEEIESFLVLESVHYRTDWAKLAQLRARKLPASAGSALDDLDRAIVEQLQENARTSLREVGRRLGRSEGTIRARLRRLEAEELCRIQAVTDVSIGPGICTAWLALKARRGWVRRVARAIAKAPEAGFVGITLGRFDVVALVNASDRAELSRLVFERLALHPGVQRLEAWESLSIYKHDFRIADLGRSAAPPPARRVRAKRRRRRS